MHKNLLTKEEVQELLSEIPADASDERTAGIMSDRSGDHAEITIRYLQQTVQELQREMAELRDRMQALEKAQSTGKSAPASPVKKTPAAQQQGSDPKAEVPLSRKEKFKAERGKWF